MIIYYLQPYNEIYIYNYSNNMNYYFKIIIFILTSITIYDLLRHNINNFNIYGNGKNTIVFIHGLNDDPSCWQKQIPVFSKKYTCIVINRTSSKNYIQDNEIYNIIQNNRTKGKLFCITASYGSISAFNIHKKYNIFDRIIFMNIIWNPWHSYDWDNKSGIFVKSIYL